MDAIFNILRFRFGKFPVHPVHKIQELGISGAQEDTQHTRVEIAKSPLFMRLALKNEQLTKKCKNRSGYNNMLF